MIQVGGGDFRYRVDENWPSFPVGGPDGEAVAVACDPDDNVYVFLRGPFQIQAFAPDGSPRAKLAEGIFDRPHGLFIDKRAFLYCTHDFGHSVHVYSTELTLNMVLGNPRHPSDTGATSIDYRSIKHSGPPFHFPTNLALGPTGDIFVADGYGNARIHRFNPDGQLLHSWGEPGSGPGQFQVPHGIAVDRQGVVYVADRENSRLQLFSSDGAYLQKWTDVARPCQVFIDPEDNVCVAELGFRAGRWPGTGEAEPGQTGGRVSIFDRAGNLLSRWGGGTNPCAPGDFFAPHGIWVDSHGDLYVCEVGWSAGGNQGRVPASCHTLQKFVRVK